MTDVIRRGGECSSCHELRTGTLDNTDILDGTIGSKRSVLQSEAPPGKASVCHVPPNVADKSSVLITPKTASKQHTDPLLPSSYQEQIEEVPKEYQTDHSLHEKWNAALAKFKKSVDKRESKSLQEKAFKELIELSIQRHRVDDLSEKIAESRKIKKQAEDALAKLRSDAPTQKRILFRDAWYPGSVSQPQYHRLCHGTEASKKSFLEPLDREISAKKELAARHDKIIAGWEKIREKAYGRVERDMLSAVRDVEGTTPVDNDLPVELKLSPITLTIFADTFKSLNDFDRAKKYYTAAAGSPAISTASAAWYRVQALQMDVLGGDKKKIKAAIEEIKELRESLTPLLFTAQAQEIEKSLSPAEEDENVAGLEGGRPWESAGSVSQIHTVDALSWGVLYDAYMSDYAANRGKLLELEAERRKMVAGRKGNTTYIEADLHLQNMQRVAHSQTVHGGVIEETLRNDNAAMANKKFDQLVRDVGDVYHVIKPYMEKKRGDALFERFATLNWTTFVEGNMARDLPKLAITSLSRYILKNPSAGDQKVGDDCLAASAPWFSDNGKVVGFGESENIRSLMARLSRTAPQIFDKHGLLNPNVDLSGSLEGRETAEKLMTAYWKSGDSVREFGMPVAAGVVCYAGAAALWETGPIAFLAAAACAGGGSFLNREINLSTAKEQYRQAAMTGISRISEKEARINRRMWYFDGGMNAVFVATFIAPGLALYGRLALGAVKDGLLRAGAWVAAKEGGRQVLKRVVGHPLKSLGGAAATVGRGTKSAVSGFWKLPVRTRLGIAGFVAATADGLFIDGDGKFVLTHKDEKGKTWPFDGKLDHWWGHVGAALALSEGGHRIFSWSWHPAFRREIMYSGTSGKIRNGVIRTGIDMAAADYFLVRKTDDGKYAFVDFNAPRRNVFEERAYENQIGVDVPWLGGLGLLLSGGDWYRSEIKEMSNLYRVLVIGGTVPVGIDMWDMKLDHPISGVGGSIAVSVMGNRMLNVNAWGSMVFLPMKVSYEWIMQAMQEQDLKTPDAKRMISATAESAFMMMLVKGFYEGSHFWHTFPLGRRLYVVGDKIPVLRNVRAFEDWGRYQRLGGNKPAIIDHEMYEVTGVRHGSKTVFKLRNDKRWNGLGVTKDSEEIELVVIEGKRRGQIGRMKKEETGPIHGIRFYINGKEVEYEELLNNAIVWRRGKVFAARPIREGFTYTGGRTLTIEEYNNALKHDPAVKRKLDAELDKLDWRAVEGKEGLVTHFERDWTVAPYSPSVFFKEPPNFKQLPRKFKDVKSSITVYRNDTPEWRRRAPVFMKKYEKKIDVWLRFTREPKIETSVVIGGKKNIWWTGPREKPRFTYKNGQWRGVVYQGPFVLAMAFGANYTIFSKTSDADKDYQPWQRFFNYLPTVFFTWPVIQARYGLDSWKGRSLGGLVGYAANPYANWLFPTYCDTTPGQTRFFRHLDSGGSIKGANVWYNPMSHDGIKSLRRTVTSGSLSTPDSWYEIEHDAMSTLRRSLDCRMDIANGKGMKNSKACVELPYKAYNEVKKAESEDTDKTKKVTRDVMKKRFDALAKLFREKMEYERVKDLPERERRMLIIMGAWFKSVLKGREDDEALAGLRRVKTDYAWFFKDDHIPNLKTDDDWKSYIKQVNGGRARASNFYFDPHIHDGVNGHH